MKKFLSLIILAVLILGCIPTNALAGGIQEKTENIIYFDNGDYITITVTQTQNRASGTITGSKTYTYTDNSNEAHWKAVITGTFTYTGTSATCTASNCNVTIYDSAWYVVSKTTGKSGNKATADLTMGRKLLGITITKKSLSLQITCDANGNLS